MNKLKRFATIVLTVMMLFNCYNIQSVNASDDTVNTTDTTLATSEQRIASNEAAVVPVTLDAEPITINVTLPTSLPVVVDSDGNVTVATNAELKNNSTGAVQIKSVTIQPNADWKLVSFDKEFTQLSNKTSEFGMQINSVNVEPDGSVDITRFPTTIVQGHDTESDAENSILDLKYDANVAFQHERLTGVNLASVSIVIDWYDPLGEARLAAEKAGVGGEITLKMLNSSGEYEDVPFIVVNDGNPDPDIYDSSCDGYWLLSKYCIVDNIQWKSSNGNDYANSNAKSQLDTLADRFEINVPTVRIPYWAGTTDNGSLKKGADGLSVQLFLLSEMEVGGNQDTDLIEGAQLAYFELDNPEMIAYNASGSATNWWLRSPSPTASNYAYRVNTSGALKCDYAVTHAYGLRIALII